MTAGPTDGPLYGGGRGMTTACEQLVHLARRRSQILDGDAPRLSISQLKYVVLSLHCSG